MWPHESVPITFVSFELGIETLAGGVLMRDGPEELPCRRAYGVFYMVILGQDTMTWTWTYGMETHMDMGMGMHLK